MRQCIRRWLTCWALLLALACSSPEPQPPAPAPLPEHPVRIISLAPSITEILFALNLDERIVGVTQFCNYPPAATERTSVGGYYNPNYEAMIALKPDLVILLREHTREREHFDSLGVPWLEVNHHSIAKIFASMETIGQATGSRERAKRLIADLKTKLEKIGHRTKNLPRPKVLVSVGRNMGTGNIEDAYVAGQGSIFNELITLAGGQNAFQEGGRAYPVVSAEGLLLLNPDIVFDMVPHREGSGLTVASVRAEWEALPRLAAVRSARVHVFDQDYVTIPGPRIFLLLEQMARVIHPEQFATPTQEEPP